MQGARGGVAEEDEAARMVGVSRAGGSGALLTAGGLQRLRAAAAALSLAFFILLVWTIQTHGSPFR
jgi:hypothetical protein